MTRTITTAPRVEHISAARDTDLATRTGQMRYLVQHLGWSRRQAHARIRDFEAAMTKRIGNRREVTDAEWIAWLMQQAPGPGRARPVRKHDWRVAS